MSGFFDHIEQSTRKNENFRKVIFTGKYAQLVLMSLLPGEDIGMETHDTVDQFFRFEAGDGKVIIEGEEFTVGDGDAIIVPAGSQHNIINTSTDKTLKIYTIYSPPNHPDGTIHKDKTEAEAYEQQQHS